MRALAVIVIGLLLGSACWAQSHLIIGQKSQFCEPDLKGHLYLVDGAVLRKYDAQAQYLGQYAKMVNGDITSIDVTNPMRPMVFWAQSNVVQFLDHDLAELGSGVSLAPWAESGALAVCAASAGGFWLIEPNGVTLTGITSDRRVAHQSESLVPFIGNAETFYLTEHNQTVYLVTPEKVLMFDIFAAYLGAIPIKCTTKPLLTNQTIVFFNQNGLQQYSLLTKETTILLPKPDNKVTSMTQLNQLRVMQYPDSVIIWHWYNK